MKNSAKILSGFGCLFLLYHAAEYMIIFQNSVAGYLIGQSLFFISANQIAMWQGQKGLATWGLDISVNTFRILFSGMLMGIGLYGSSWLFNIILGVERINKIPAGSFQFLVKDGLFFSFGVFFSSLSEDILTRGYLYFHLREKVTPGSLIVISAVTYLLNHIYKLGDGPEAWLYLFPLGLLYVIPLLITRNLWYTVAMHWAGNVFFYMSHNLIDTQSVNSHLPPNYLFCLFIVLFIPVAYFLLRMQKW